MKVVELTMEQLHHEALRLADAVGRDFQPDCVVYIARAGLPVARPMAQLFDAPLVEMRALRPGSRLKSLLAPMLRRLPTTAKCLLRRAELGARGLGIQPMPRRIELAEDMVPAHYRRILVVDDSVDTGATLAAVCRQVHKRFGECSMRTAALNVWDGSARRVKTDYCLYRNALLMTPMSRDSAAYPAFVAAYGVKA